MRKVIERLGRGDTLEILPADIDEKAIRDNDPAALTQQLALAKSRALQPRLAPQDRLIVTADTVVVFGHAIREKPENIGEAREFLRSMARRGVEAVTSAAVAWIPGEQQKIGCRSWDVVTFTDRTSILFKPFSEESIEMLIADGVAMKYAGAFAIDHPLYQPFIAGITGDWSAAAGLSIDRTVAFIRMIRDEVL